MKNKSNATQKKDIPVVDVFSLSGKKVDKFKLNSQIFNAEPNRALLHQVIVMYRANQRQSTASTKTRARVRGGGKKPWRQKGTGRARAGSIRSPLWRGGGVVFGPRVRDFGYSMPKKMKRLALISSLSGKTKDKEIMVLDKEIELNQPKTKDAARILKALKIYSKRVLLISSKKNTNVIKSCRNIRSLTTRIYSDVNAYDVLSNSRILFSEEVHDLLVKRIEG